MLSWCHNLFHYLSLPFITPLCLYIPDLYEGEIAGNAVLESSVARVADIGDCEQAYDVELMRVKGMLEGMFSAREAAMTTTDGLEGGGGEGVSGESLMGGALLPSAAAIEVT